MPNIMRGFSAAAGAVAETAGYLEKERITQRHAMAMERVRNKYRDKVRKDTQMHDLHKQEQASKYRISEYQLEQPAALAKEERTYQRALEKEQRGYSQQEKLAGIKQQSAIDRKVKLVAGAFPEESDEQVKRRVYDMETLKKGKGLEYRKEETRDKLLDKYLGELDIEDLEEQDIQKIERRITRVVNDAFPKNPLKTREKEAAAKAAYIGMFATLVDRLVNNLYSDGYLRPGQIPSDAQVAAAEEQAAKIASKVTGYNADEEEFVAGFEGKPKSLRKKHIEAGKSLVERNGGAARDKSRKEQAATSGGTSVEAPATTPGTTREERRQQFRRVQ